MLAMRRLRHQNGLTIIELMIAVAIIGILSAVAGLTYVSLREKACTTIARYDLKKFFEAEHDYVTEHNVYCGEVGDILSNTPGIESTFRLPNYSPSPGTIIRIINDDPFTAQAMQLGVPLVFECDTLTGIITERRRQ